MNKFFFLLFSLFFMLNSFAYAQKDTEPARIDNLIKKQKGKYGLWSKELKKWYIEPEYSKITGIAFTDKAYETENRTFFKLWRENTFDLLQVTSNTKTYMDDYKIWIKDISGVLFPAYNAPAGAVYDHKDFTNFIYYNKNGKWGWYANKFFSRENITMPPGFDNPPVAKYAFKISFHEDYNNYILETDSAGFKGLYTLLGNQLLKPAQNLNYQVQSPDYIITKDEKGLLGFNMVPPQYARIDRIQSTYYTNHWLYLFTLPDGTKGVRTDESVLTNEDILKEAKVNKAFFEYARLSASAKTVLGNMLIELKEDNTGTIKKIGDSVVNIGFSSYVNKESYKTYTFEINGNWIYYFELEGKAVKFNYRLAPGEYEFSFDASLPEKPWPGDKKPVPVMLAMKGDKWLMINCLNNKRREIPITLTPKHGVIKDGKEYRYCGFYDYDNIRFCREDTILCPKCTKGYTEEKVTVHTKESVSYKSVPVTKYKESGENVWDPNRNTYVWKTTKKRVTEYEDVKEVTPASSKEEIRGVRCKSCLGKYKQSVSSRLRWNGSALVADN